jgi:Flp pilus assembly pilin Flp
MFKLYVRALSWLNRQDGQDLAEYALLVGFIAIAVVATLAVLGEALLDFFQTSSRLIAAGLGLGE